MSAVSTELGAALLSDSAHHLDHGTEHAAHVRHQLGSGRWFSGAWQTVTFYYWSYFLALSLTELSGKTGVFLSKEPARALSTLSGGLIHPGPWTIECGPTTSLGRRDVELRKSARTRLHELIWHHWFNTLEACISGVETSQRDPVEDRLYEALRRSAQRLGDAWPSDLRNLVNYRPGLGYGAIRRTTRNEAFTAIPIQTASDFATVLDRFESNIAGLPAHVEDGITTTTRALIDMTFVLDLIARELHGEVVQRRGIDARWMTARAAFARSQAAHYGSRDWPVSLRLDVAP